jgi:hypothetical protein
MRLLNGTPVDELSEAADPTTSSTIPNGADDMSIRVPRPVFELPERSQPPSEL